ncbi:hypothetical protein D9X30_2215 [Cupriavidus sp. U2]|nr:hypothetical protein D9X30_2215 [Cupriavidus sp. U2]
MSPFLCRIARRRFAVPVGLAKHTVFLYSTRHSARVVPEGTAQGRDWRVQAPKAFESPPKSIGKGLKSRRHAACGLFIHQLTTH